MAVRAAALQQPTSPLTSSLLPLAALTHAIDQPHVLGMPMPGHIGLQTQAHMPDAGVIYALAPFADPLHTFRPQEGSVLPHRCD